MPTTQVKRTYAVECERQDAKNAKEIGWKTTANPPQPILHWRVLL
jgi:hypothetical protein